MEKLEPMFSRRKSFYGKAIVRVENGETILTSYTTDVCKIDKNNNFIRLWSGYSATTKEHINEFRQQYDLQPLSKKEWLSLPCNNGNQYKVVGMNGLGTTYTPQAIFGNIEEAEQFCDDLNCRDTYWSYWVEEV